MCFSMFVYIRARIHFVLIGGNLTAQSTGSHIVVSSPSISRPAARVSQELPRSLVKFRLKFLT